MRRSLPVQVTTMSAVDMTSDSRTTGKPSRLETTITRMNCIHAHIQIQIQVYWTCSQKAKSQEAKQTIVQQNNTLRDKTWYEMQCDEKKINSQPKRLIWEKLGLELWLGIATERHVNRTATGSDINRHNRFLNRYRCQKITYVKH